MAEWMHTAFGTGLLLLASLGFLHLLARPRGAPATRETWLLVGAGALPSLLFWRHAIVHEFWPLILAPGMACLAGRGSWVVLRAAGRRGPALVGAALLGLALVTALTVRDARALLERYDTTIFRDRGRALNEHVTAKDLVLVPGDLTADRFYTHAPMIPLLNDAAALETLRARYRGRIEGVDRVFIFWPRAWMEEGAWLKSVARESWLPIRWGDSDGILIETPRRSWD